MRLLGDIGILAEAPAQVVFAIQVEAKHVFHLERGSGDRCGRWQAVFKADRAQIGYVLHIALGLRHQQENRVLHIRPEYVAQANAALARPTKRARWPTDRYKAAAFPQLLVRTHPDLVVVGQHEAKFYHRDLGFIGRGAVDKRRAVKVVEQADLPVAIGGEKPLPLQAAADHRAKANVAARLHRAVAVGDNHV